MQARFFYAQNKKNKKTRVHLTWDQCREYYLNYQQFNSLIIVYGTIRSQYGIASRDNQDDIKCGVADIP